MMLFCRTELCERNLSTAEEQHGRGCPDESKDVRIAGIDNDEQEWRRRGGVVQQDCLCIGQESCDNRKEITTMEAEFWHHRWETDDTGWDQGEPNSLLAQCWGHLAVPAGSSVLVPLCGKSVDMTWLEQAGHRVLGVELSEDAVQRYFDSRGLTTSVSRDEQFTLYEADSIRILAGDIFGLTRDHLQDIAAVYDRASLIALPPEMRDAYVALLKDILPPGVETLLITFEKPAGETDGPPFSVDRHEVGRLFAEDHVIRELASQQFDPDGMNFREVAWHLQRTTGE